MIIVLDFRFCLINFGAVAGQHELATVSSSLKKWTVMFTVRILQARKLPRICFALTLTESVTEQACLRHTS